MKEATEFYAKIKIDREVQEKKIEIENAVSAGRGVWHFCTLSGRQNVCVNRMGNGDTKTSWR